VRAYIDDRLVARHDGEWESLSCAVVLTICRPLQ